MIGKLFFFFPFFLIWFLILTGNMIFDQSPCLDVFSQSRRVPLFFTTVAHPKKLGAYDFFGGKPLPRFSLWSHACPYLCTTVAHPKKLGAYDFFGVNLYQGLLYEVDVCPHLCTAIAQPKKLGAYDFLGGKHLPRFTLWSRRVPSFVHNSSPAKEVGSVWFFGGKHLPRFAIWLVIHLLFEVVQESIQRSSPNLWLWINEPLIWCIFIRPVKWVSISSFIWEVWEEEMSVIHTIFFLSNP